MRKIINAPEKFVDEVLEGLLLAHPDALTIAPGSARALVAVAPTRPGQVAIATGGGSGHLPLFLGYVGNGLAHGAAVGNVFSSPSADDMLAVTRAIDAGGGVLYLYGNYGGDVFNFDDAAARAEADGIRVTTVLGTDDILSAPHEVHSTRRGVAGLALAFKTAGAAARRGLSLDDVAHVAQRTIDNTRTMGVGLAPTILPEAGAATFELEPGEMEIGIGIHGEPGQYRGPIESADTIADRFVNTLLEEVRGRRVAVLVNGLGATPLEELYVLYRRVARQLEERGISIAQRYIGEYATSLEMAGASVSLCALDPELESLLDDPADAALFAAWGRAPQTSRVDARPGIDGRPRAGGGGGGAHQKPASTTTASEQQSGREFAALIATAMRQWASCGDELRALDSVLGDGDLGITVVRGSSAVIEALSSSRDDWHPSAVIAAAARAFGAANPSTFAALASLGCSALADAIRENPHDWAHAAEAALLAVQQRGGAQVGDKTMIDPWAAVVTALHNHPDITFSGLVEVAQEATDGTADLRSARGRAAWTGERSMGQRDPGSVALTRLLESLRDAEASAKQPRSAATD